MDNPYDSPTSITSQASVEPHRRPTNRPLGVSILAVLHFLGGVMLLGSQFYLFANLQAMEQSLRSIGVSPVLLVVSATFLAVLAIASGVGMWVGAKWGWWCALFYYVYSIIRNSSALLTVVAMAGEIEGGTRTPEYYMVKHGGRIIVSVLLCLYLFKGNVLAFFDLETLSKPKAMGIVVGMGIAITAAISAFRVISN